MIRLQVSPEKCWEMVLQKLKQEIITAAPFELFVGCEWP